MLKASSIKTAYIFLSIFFGSCALEAQEHSSTALKQQLDKIATQDVPEKAPGIATAIIMKGDIVYKKYAGYANFTDSSLIKADTRFNIASNGKQFTALTIAWLAKKGKLSLNDDIRKYFTNLLPRVKQKITIQHLLTHSSGIRDIYDLLALQGITWWKQSLNQSDVLSMLYKQQEVNFDPGSKYLYSNSNYILLASIIEKVSGKSFREATDEVFGELGMFSTHFEQDYSMIQGPIAKSYFNFGKWTTYDWVWNVVGDGNLFTTLDDLIRWELVVQGKIVTELGLELIRKSQQPLNQSNIQQYGYGVEFGNYKGKPYVFHEGATGAWKATVIRFPSDSVSMITLTNTGKSIPFSQTRQMADLFFKLDNQTPTYLVRPSVVGDYVATEAMVGTYLTEQNFFFRFEEIGGKLFLVRSGRNNVELERESANVFHQKFDTAFKQAFEVLQDGSTKVTAYYTTHAPYSLIKKKVDWYGFDYTAPNGDYMNVETGVTLSVRWKENRNYQVVRNAKDSSSALLINKTDMLYNGYKIEFVTDKGTPTLLLDGERIRRVRFQKK